MKQKLKTRKTHTFRKKLRSFSKILYTQAYFAALYYMICEKNKKSQFDFFRLVQHILFRKLEINFTEIKVMLSKEEYYVKTLQEHQTKKKSI